MSAVRPPEGERRRSARQGATVSPSRLPLPGIDAIPQRPPFRFIDAIVAGEPGVFAEARLCLAGDDPLFGGHFPGAPVVPGVLMIEQMAQTACWVLAARDGGAARYVLVRVNACEFKRQVGPGDTLVARATLERRAGAFAFFDCSVRCQDLWVARAQLLVAEQPAAAPSHPSTPSDGVSP